MAPLPPLATVGELESRLTTSLTDAQRARAHRLLVDASAAVRRVAGGQQFTAGESTVRLKVKNGKVRLPQRPVNDVTAVEDVNGNAVTFTWEADEWVKVPPNVPDTFAWEPWSNGITHVDVTYEHGYDEVPFDVVAVVCQMAGRALGTPADESGMTEESIGTYSYRVGVAAASGAVGMLPDERTLIEGYGRQVAATSLMRE